MRTASRQTWREGMRINASIDCTVLIMTASRQIWRAHYHLQRSLRGPPACLRSQSFQIFKAKLPLIGHLHDKTRSVNDLCSIPSATHDLHQVQACSGQVGHAALPPARQGLS